MRNKKEEPPTVGIGPSLNMYQPARAESLSPSAHQLAPLQDVAQCAFVVGVAALVARRLIVARALALDKLYKVRDTEREGQRLRVGSRARLYQQAVIMLTNGKAAGSHFVKHPANRAQDALVVVLRHRSRTA